MADEGDELEGAAQFFGVETPGGEATRAGEQRDEEDYQRERAFDRWKADEAAKAKAGATEQDEEDYREAVEANKRLGLRAHAGDAPPTAAEFGKGLERDFLDKPAATPKKTGCSPKLLAVALVAVGIILAVLVLLTRDDEHDKSDISLPGTEDECTNPSTLGTDEIVLISVTQECPSEDPAATDDGTVGTEPSGDVSAFAGRWVLVEGLDDPSGVDAGVPYPEKSPSTVSSSAEFVIEPDGTISGGSYRVSVTIDLGCGVEEWVEDLDGATGSVAATGSGTVMWTGSRRSSTNCNDDTAYPGAGQTRNFWITGDEMVMCRAALATPTTCAAPVTRVAAKFRRG